MTYKVHVPGIMVQAKGLRGPKGDPGDITDASTYFQATSLMSDYAHTTHTHTGAGSYSTSGNNATITYNNSGIHVSVAPPEAAANSVYTVAGGYASLSINGVSTTISVTGLQPAGAYLTTAAESDHTHDYQSSGAYLTTAANSTHIHGSIATSLITGSVITNSSASSGVTFGIPNYLTTAADPLHNHAGQYLEVSRSDEFYNTASYTFANSTHIHGGVISTATNGSNVSFNSASDGFTIAIPPFITATNSTHTHFSSIIGQNATVNTTGSILYVSVVAPVPLANSTQYATSYLSGTFMNTSASSLFMQSWELEGANTAGTTGSLQGGTLYFSGGDNITLSGNSNTIIISGNAGGGTGGVAIGNTATIPFTSGSVMFSGTNLTVNTSADGASQYIQLSVAAPEAAANAVHAGDYISLSTDGVSTTVSATNLQASSLMSNWIHQSQSGVISFSNANGITFGTTTSGSSTTVTADFNSTYYMAQSSTANFFLDANTSLLAVTGHTHGSNVSSIVTNGSDLLFSSASNGLTISIPPYLTTAAQLTHTHGSIFTSLLSTGSVITNSSASSGLTLGIPGYITTAAGVSHSHGNPTLSLSNLSGATASASSGLTISLTGYPATSFVNVSETGNIYFANPDGISGSNMTFGSSVSSNSTSIYITAGGATGGGAGTGFSSGSTSSGTDIKGTLNSNGLSLIYPAYLTTGGAGGLGAFELSGNTSGSTTASGSTVQLYGGNNITLSGYDGSKIRIDGAQGSVYFSDGNGLAFSTSVNGISTTVYGSIESSLLTLPELSNYAGIQSTGITGGSATINSSQVLINVPTQTGQIISASNGSYTYSVLSLGTENNVTFYTTEAGGFPSIIASINATGGGPLVSYSGTISVTNGYLSVNTDGYHKIQVGSPNETDSGTHYFVNNNIDLYNNQLYNDKYLVDSNSPLATHSEGGVVIMPNGAHLQHNEWIYYSTNPLSYSQNAAAVVLDISKGLYYGNFTGNNVSYSSGWSTYSNWIPNKKYVDDQISTVTAGGGGNWELAGTKTAGTTASAFDTLYLQGGNNITLSGNSNTIVFSVADAAGQSQQPMYYSASGTSTSASTLAFGNSNGITWGLNNGSIIGTVATDYAASGHTHNYIGVNTSISSGYGGSTLAMSANSSGVTLSVPAWVTAASGGGGVALGNTATVPFTSGSVMISGSGLTVNTSADGASQWLQIQAPAIGYLYFSNTNGHSWSSATSGASTSIYIITA